MLDQASLFALLGPSYLVVVAWPLALTDWRELRLPNRLVLPSFPVTLVGQLISSFLLANFQQLSIALLIAVATFLIALGINQSGFLGMGDVKLMTAISLALGWYSPLLPIAALALALIVAGAVALVLLALRRLRLGASMPLGPYLLAGFLAAITWAVWS